MDSTLPAPTGTEDQISVGEKTVTADVLFVDLDGTLTTSDLFGESLLLTVSRAPKTLLSLPRWALRGRAATKFRLAKRITPDAATLPYREEVVNLIRLRKRARRRRHLSHRQRLPLGRRRGRDLGLFSGVLASDGLVNLKGAAKLEAIEAYCRKHGYRTFAYVGDSSADLPIWRRTAQAFAVAPGKRLLKSLRSLDCPVQLLGQRSYPWRSVACVLRPHQWAKNTLLLVPLILAHQLTVLGSWLCADGRGGIQRAAHRPSTLPTICWTLTPTAAIRPNGTAPSPRAVCRWLGAPC